MFDIGLTEVIMIFVVALLVVGPERLPRIARTTGLWIGKMRGFVATVKADIDRELATEELKKALAKQASVPELEEMLDEVTGKPLQAGEIHRDKQQAAVEQVDDTTGESAGDDKRS